MELNEVEENTIYMDSNSQTNGSSGNGEKKKHKNGGNNKTRSKQYIKKWNYLFNAAYRAIDSLNFHIEQAEDIEQCSNFLCYIEKTRYDVMFLMEKLNALNDKPSNGTTPIYNQELSEFNSLYFDHFGYNNSLCNMPYPFPGYMPTHGMYAYPIYSYNQQEESRSVVGEKIVPNEIIQDKHTYDSLNVTTLEKSSVSENIQEFPAPPSVDLPAHLNIPPAINAAPGSYLSWADKLNSVGLSVAQPTFGGNIGKNLKKTTPKSAEFVPGFDSSGPNSLKFPMLSSLSANVKSKKNVKADTGFGSLLSSSTYLENNLNVNQLMGENDKEEEYEKVWKEAEEWLDARAIAEELAWENLNKGGSPLKNSMMKSALNFSSSVPFSQSIVPDSLGMDRSAPRSMNNTDFSLQLTSPIGFGGNFVYNKMNTLDDRLVSMVINEDNVKVENRLLSSDIAEDRIVSMDNKRTVVNSEVCDGKQSNVMREADGDLGQELRLKTPESSPVRKSSEYSTTPPMYRTLHDKLSSPERRKAVSPENARLRQEQKQLQAEINRDRSVQERVQKAVLFSSRVSKASEEKALRMSENSANIEQKMQEAELRREEHIKAIKDKANNENAKVSEVAFINSMNDEEVQYALQQKLQDAFKRMVDVDERRRKHMEDIVGKQKMKSSKIKSQLNELKLKRDQLMLERLDKYQTRIRDVQLRKEKRLALIQNRSGMSLSDSFAGDDAILGGSGSFSLEKLENVENDTNSVKNMEIMANEFDSSKEEIKGYKKKRKGESVNTFTEEVGFDCSIRSGNDTQTLYAQRLDIFRNIYQNYKGGMVSSGYTNLEIAHRNVSNRISPSPGNGRRSGNFHDAVATCAVISTRSIVDFHDCNWSKSLYELCLDEAEMSYEKLQSFINFCKQTNNSFFASWKHQNEKSQFEDPQAAILLWNGKVVDLLKNLVKDCKKSIETGQSCVITQTKNPFSRIFAINDVLTGYLSLMQSFKQLSMPESPSSPIYTSTLLIGMVVQFLISHRYGLLNENCVNVLFDLSFASAIPLADTCKNLLPASNIVCNLLSSLEFCYSLLRLFSENSLFPSASLQLSVLFVTGTLGHRVLDMYNVLLSTHMKWLNSPVAYGDGKPWSNDAFIRILMGFVRIANSSITYLSSGLKESQASGSVRSAFSVFSLHYLMKLLGVKVQFDSSIFEEGSDRISFAINKTSIPKNLDEVQLKRLETNVLSNCFLPQESSLCTAVSRCISGFQTQIDLMYDGVHAPVVNKKTEKTVTADCISLEFFCAQLNLIQNLCEFSSYVLKCFSFLLKNEDSHDSKVESRTELLNYVVARGFISCDLVPNLVTILSAVLWQNGFDHALHSETSTVIPVASPLVLSARNYVNDNDSNRLSLSNFSYPSSVRATPAQTPVKKPASPLRGNVHASSKLKSARYSTMILYQCAEIIQVINDIGTVDPVILQAIPADVQVICSHALEKVITMYVKIADDESCLGGTEASRHYKPHNGALILPDTVSDKRDGKYSLKKADRTWTGSRIADAGLVNTLDLVSFICLNNSDLVASMFSESRGSIVLKLCQLPVKFITKQCFRAHLFPALISLCVESKSNFDLYKQEMSPTLILEFMRDIHKCSADRSNECRLCDYFDEIVRVFPQEYWGKLKDFALSS